MSVAAQNVLGGIIIGGKDAYWRVADVLKAEDFPTAQLSNLYRVCSDIAESAADLDVISIGDEAARRGVMQSADVTDIASRTASFANIRGHAELVKRDAVERKVRAICSEGAKSGDVATVQAQLGALLNAQPAHAITALEACTRMWDDVIARHAAGDDLAGLTTGFPKIDELTGGLQPGRVYGIGGRAKMGKTMLAMNICANIGCPPTGADGQQLWPAKHVGIWSLEMSSEELMQRMACAYVGLPSSVLMRPRLLDAVEEAWPKLNVAIKALKGSLLRVSDRTDVSIEEIEAQARQMHNNGQLSLLCIDYLGLLRTPKMDRHDLAIAHITRRVKIIAKELRIPVILVFQLNRGNEGRVVTVPSPSNAKDSGAIEQDVDAMFLLHRPSYYDKKAPKGLRLDLAIQRNGPTGLIRMNDELHCCRFTGGTDEWVDATQSGGMDEDL